MIRKRLIGASSVIQTADTHERRESMTQTISLSNNLLYTFRLADSANILNLLYPGSYSNLIVEIILCGLRSIKKWIAEKHYIKHNVSL